MLSTHDVLVLNMAVLSKSQKEANNLAQRYSGENEKVRHDQQHTTRDANLENDLTSQWRSLFQHMEDMFASESSQLVRFLLNSAFQFPTVCP